MSATFNVKGTVYIRLDIDTNITCSSSSTADAVKQLAVWDELDSVLTNYYPLEVDLEVTKE